MTDDTTALRGACGRCGGTIVDHPFTSITVQQKADIGLCGDCISDLRPERRARVVLALFEDRPGHTTTDAERKSADPTHPGAYYDTDD